MTFVIIVALLLLQLQLLELESCMDFKSEFYDQINNNNNIIITLLLLIYILDYVETKILQLFIGNDFP